MTTRSRLSAGMPWFASIAGLALFAGCGGGDDGRGDQGASAGIESFGGTSADDPNGEGGGDDDDDDDDSADGTGGDDDDDANDTFDNDAELLFIAVEPAEQVVELDLGEAGAQDFMVIGHYTDGSTADMTAEADFGADNPNVGVMNGTTLDIAAHNEAYFDSTIITAEVEGFQGQAQLTVAIYDQAEDFFFVLPYEDPEGPQTKPLTFSTDVKILDVFFAMDTTGSMGGPISGLQNALVGIIADIQAQIADANFGVASFEDYPIDNYGTAGCNDQPFELFTPITNDVNLAQNGVNMLSNGGSPIGCGADGAESSIEALYQIATGTGLVAPPPTNVAPNMDGIGGVGFREDAMPVVVSITDAVSHNSEGCGVDYAGAVAAVAASEAEAMEALQNICARVVPVAVGFSNGSAGGCNALGDGIDYANATGSVIPPEAWDLAPGGRPAGCAAITGPRRTLADQPGAPLLSYVPALPNSARNTPLWRRA